MESAIPSWAAILFDRDGTLIKDRHYLADPAGVELLPGVGEALGGFVRRGIRLFVVSNQSGVGRGMFSPESVHACNQRMAELLTPYGAAFEDMIFCPHAPDEGCLCRKPAPGMWRALRDKRSLSAQRCLMVGDKEEDMLFAANAGLAARILVLTGKGAATAAKLGLARPCAPAVLVTRSPASPAHPHICIPSFFFLEKGLALFRAGQEGLCET